MAFQPFGYRFEVNSVFPPEQAKAAIRAKKKRWLDKRTGPRGWIAGPFICLWLRAFDRHGPMLIGTISSDNLGTRVSGRAGSDLNGVVLFAVLIPVLAAFLYNSLAQGSATTDTVMIVGGLILISPLVLWWNHKDRHEADPLVAFLHQALSAEQARKRRAIEIPPYSADLLPLKLHIGGDEMVELAKPAAILEAIEAIENNEGFLILEKGPQHFMQAAWMYPGLVLELREGGEDRHFVAIRTTEPEPGQAGRQPGDRLTGQEVVNALVGYLEGRTEIEGFRWQPVRS